MTTFAPMKTKTRRRIASWVLLAVFLPMLVLSAFHIHDYQAAADDECEACVQHVPHEGHLYSHAFVIHACVLCQLTTLSYLPPVVVALGVLLMGCRRRQWQYLVQVPVVAMTLPSLRGPPFLLCR